MANKGKLFLIPNVIAENTQDLVLSFQLKNLLPNLHYFLAEDIRTARRYLSSLKVYPEIASLNFSTLDKNTREAEVAPLLAPVFDGHDVGIISESGCPGIADPGALAVNFAHSNGIQVVPLVGPSSILLSLMASGLNGQKFSFQGYLPVDSQEFGKVIKELEKESKLKHQTQIFIETPYRNNALFQKLLKHLNHETQVCIAMDLTGESEYIATKRVKEWKMQTFEWPKKPAIFLFLA
jgi:16S rRNA (cytidine1402-2'-O)-methyltransferase